MADFYGTTYYSRKLNGSNPGRRCLRCHNRRRFHDACINSRQAEGYDISAGLVQGFDGNFYGTASQGGLSGYGTIFSMTPAGAVTVLHNFAGPEGAVPAMGLVQANDGNFYGATYGGGNDYGVIFRITPFRHVYATLQLHRQYGWRKPIRPPDHSVRMVCSTGRPLSTGRYMAGQSSV